MKFAVALIALALATGSAIAADETKAAAPKKEPAGCKESAGFPISGAP